MYIQCPQCRTLNEYNDILLSSSGENHPRCLHCQADINIPPTLKAMFSNVLPRRATSRLSENILPESSLIADSDYSEFNETNEIRHRYPSPSGRWIAPILGLLVIFILQYGYFMRNNLARHDALRPWLERLCQLADCNIPMRRDISKIIIVNRDIRSTPNAEDILQVDITLKNIAPYAQPFPKIQLSFSDITGKKIASRRFKPDEYLSEQTIDPGKGMPPQIPVIASLQILDPGEHAITFEFEFF
jgi:hypothetical protein